VLGIPRAARAWRSRRAGPSALVTHLLMAAWFVTAGVWVMFTQPALREFAS
jgi:hypothetical protein